MIQSRTGILPRGRVPGALAALLCAAGLGVGHAAEPGQALGDGPLDLGDFPATAVGRVIVPVPSEVFGVLEKLGESGWKDEIRRRAVGPSRERTQVALILGVAVADGFVAVQAENAVGIEAAGRLVLQSAETLGTRDAVVSHCQSIFDAAKAENWSVIRAELDRVQETVRAAMLRMRDEELSELVSIGGWLRGTEAVAALIARSYTTDKAELLNQPELARHFSGVLAGLREKSPGSTRLGALAEGMEKIDAAMAADAEGVTSLALDEIHQTCASLVSMVLSLAGPQAAETGEAGLPQG